MLKSEIPFELHITIDDLSINRQNNFINFCVKEEAKPLIIELSKGDCIKQPMLSKVIFSNNIDDILSKATKLSNLMEYAEFKVKRLKIEVPSSNSDLLKTYSSNFKKYFECHIKIDITESYNIFEICDKHCVHLSLNSLKNELNIRFITLREFGTRVEFEKRIFALANDLKKSNWTIIKLQSEYCIYDNNNKLDNGWLPQ